jgi:hypothetical protein
LWASKVAARWKYDYNRADEFLETDLSTIVVIASGTDRSHFYWFNRYRGANILQLVQGDCLASNRYPGWYTNGSGCWNPYSPAGPERPNR